MRVLFMCTANSCRSILSEALFNHLAPEGFEAISSGSFPKGEVLPRSLTTLQQAGISIEGLSSKGNDASKAIRRTSSSPSATRPPAKPARCTSARR